MRKALISWIRALPVVLILMFLHIEYAGAEIRLGTEFTYDNGTFESTQKETGETTDGEFSRFSQRYNLTLARAIYPNLFFKAGSIFKLEESEVESDGERFEFNVRNILPHLELNLANPLVNGGIRYGRTDKKEYGTNFATERDFRDEYSANLSWRPVDFPLITFGYTHARTYDEPRTTEAENDFYHFSSKYSFRKFDMDYRYSRGEFEEKLSDRKTISRVHNGKFAYSDNFIDNRLSMRAGYRITYTATELVGREGGLFPALRFNGLSNDPDGLYSDPSTGLALVPNPALIDGNYAASGGIDIGLAADESLYTNIGLDLGAPTAVDKIYVWVDREVSPLVAASFAWNVCTSPDNTDSSSWVCTTPSSVIFGTFDNRFEISFPDVGTRFIKVVTRPLNPAVPGASIYPNIFVTEIEAFTTVTGQKGLKSRNLSNAYTLTLGWRHSDKTFAGYDFRYVESESDPFSAKSSSISNSLNIGHEFSNIFNGSARLLRSDSESGDMESTTHSYGASLRAAYLPTFSQTLSYGGSLIETDEGTASSNSVFLRSNAILYTGWNAFLDLGYSWGETEQDTNTRNRFLRMGTGLAPNDKFNLSMNYSVSRRQESGSPYSTSQTGAVHVFVLPLKTLNLLASVSFTDDDGDSKVFQNYSLNWLPFPDGDFQFSVSYSESLNSEGDETTIISPSLSWRIAKGVFLTTSYSHAEGESDEATSKTETLSASLRVLL